MKTLYPEIQPYQTFYLETGSLHSVYVEQSGNPDGIPVIFLHGGPCSGTKPDHRRFFNPAHYRIILFDQRACGQSLPFGELAQNTTQDLIDDMERIRIHLDIDQWLVFGGSWGGALALLYAQQYFSQVSGLIIRAVFLVRQQDLDWFMKDGVRRIYPEQWQKLVKCISEELRGDVIAGLCAVLWGDDEIAKQRATQEWMCWSALVALGTLYQPAQQELEITEKMILQARMELHYARNHYFINENQILDNCDILQSIPTRIIHGRQDLLCPIEAGMSLHQVLPNADYIVLPTAGHVAQGAEMIDALVSATDWFVETSPSR